MRDKINLFMPILKSATNGQYEAILSDTSVDRDDELMSKGLLEDWAKNSSIIPALVDHTNRVENYVAIWKNPEVIKRKGHYCLKMTPEFFKANPKAQMIKEMVDEGAPLGVSIGAIPKDFKEVDLKGKRHIMWTEAELLEASFTPIPSNRHAQIYVAKAYDLAKNILNEEEETKMSEQEEMIKKLETDVAEKTKEAEDLKKQLEDLNKANEAKEAESKKSADEVSELKKKMDEEAKAKEEMTKKFDELEKKNKDLEKKVAEAEVKLKEAPGYADEGKKKADPAQKEEKKFDNGAFIKSMIM